MRRFSSKEGFQLPRWLTDLTQAFAQGAAPAEKTVTNPCDLMHALEWSSSGERKFILFHRGRFEIAAVETREDVHGEQTCFRIEIRDQVTDEVIASRPCDNLEHAADIFSTLKCAVLDA